jgi:hypothetical protein
MKVLSDQEFSCPFSTQKTALCLTVEIDLFMRAVTKGLISGTSATAKSHTALFTDFTAISVNQCNFPAYKIWSVGSDLYFHFPVFHDFLIMICGFASKTESFKLNE